MQKLCVCGCVRVCVGKIKCARKDAREKDREGERESWNLHVQRSHDQRHMPMYVGVVVPMTNLCVCVRA